MAGIDDIIKNVDRLPALPTSTARLTTMLTDHSANLSEIEDIIKVDEALSMTVLRYANSARYGRPGREFNLHESIVRLGGKMLMKTVLEQQTQDIFKDCGDSLGLQRGAMWRGALGGAFVAERLAKTHGSDDSDLCFLCGLLRDVGKLAMDMHFGADYMPMVSKHLGAEHTFVEAERLAFGTDHAEVGGALARHWQLPERIALAIQYHHDPPSDEPEHDLLFDLVHAADIICLWAGVAIGHDGMQYRLAPHARKALNLSRQDAELEVTLVWGKIRETEQAMLGQTEGAQS